MGTPWVFEWFQRLTAIHILTGLKLRLVGGPIFRELGMLGHQEGSCFIVEMMLHYAISPASNYLCHFGLFNYLFNFRRAFHSSVAICGDYHH